MAAFAEIAEERGPDRCRSSCGLDVPSRTGTGRLGRRGRDRIADAEERLDLAEAGGLEP